MLTSHSTDRCGPVPTIMCQTIWHQVSLFTHPIGPSVVTIILVVMTFSHKPDNAILFGMVKPCLNL